MTDAHVHLDKGELGFELLDRLYYKAVVLEIDTLYLLQHTNVGGCGEIF